MEKRLRPIALHLFSKFGSTFAFEPQRLNLFQVSPLIHEILQNAGILTDADGSSPGSLDKPFVPKNQKTGMDRLVLFSSHRCNLRCKYCFNNDSESPEEKNMPIEIARLAVDFLFNHMKEKTGANITSYGGEPLLNFQCITETVRYADEKAGQCGKEIQYSIAANGI